MSEKGEEFRDLIETVEDGAIREQQGDEDSHSVRNCVDLLVSVPSSAHLFESALILLILKFLPIILVQLSLRG